MRGYQDSPDGQHASLSLYYFMRYLNEVFYSLSLSLSLCAYILVHRPQSSIFDKRRMNAGRVRWTLGATGIGSLRAGNSLDVNMLSSATQSKILISGRFFLGEDKVVK